ncbi:MAG: hypothetical protein ABIE94_03180 [archaeon]
MSDLQDTDDSTSRGTDLQDIHDPTCMSTGLQGRDYSASMSTGILLSTKETEEEQEKNRSILLVQSFEEGQPEIEVSRGVDHLGEIAEGTEILYLPSFSREDGGETGVFVDIKRFGNVTLINYNGCAEVKDGRSKIDVVSCRPWIEKGDRIPYGKIGTDLGSFADSTAHGSAVLIGYSPTDRGVYYVLIGYRNFLGEINNGIEHAIKDEWLGLNYHEKGPSFLRQENGFTDWVGHHRDYDFLENLLEEIGVPFCMGVAEITNPRNFVCLELIKTDPWEILNDDDLKNAFNADTFEVYKGILLH